MVAFLIHGLLAALCLAGRVLAQEQPETVPEPVLCTQMKKKACRLEDLCVWQGRRGGCEAATNICPAIQARKNGQNKRTRCEGIQGICECKRRRGRCGPCRPMPVVGDSGPRGGEDCWPGGTIVGPFWVDGCNQPAQDCCGACNPGIVSYCARPDCIKRGDVCGGGNGYKCCRTPPSSYRDTDSCQKFYYSSTGYRCWIIP